MKWKQRKKNVKKTARQSRRTSRFVMAEDSKQQQDERDAGYVAIMTLCSRYKV